jgi:hypothetical protein
MAMKGDHLSYALDMVVNNRLYLSTSDRMNDPYEGEYRIDNSAEHDQVDSAAVLEAFTSLRRMIDRTRFTSFCATATNPLLWAHYAGGYSGIAIKYDIPEDDPAVELLPVRYSQAPHISYEACLRIVNGTAKAHQHGLLITKRPEWAYEAEYRLFLRNGDDEYLNNVIPRAVIIGGRGSRFDSPFMRVCKRFGVPLGFLVASDLGHEVFYPDSPTGQCEPG